MANTVPTRVPELLAPAGGPEAFRAAVANGADAVYLGLQELNARRGAPNFTPETLAEATRFAHLRGRRVYLTANILVPAAEMPEALTAVDDAWTAGVDAVIVQDLGLLRLLRTELPHVRLHASTQLDAHNLASVEALAELGVSRVTLARETSLDEITAMASASPVELESFVHGALCFCYSGQCLMSSLIGGRSANRGLCAQPCRLPYALVDERGQEASCPGAYLLSPKDLAAITVLPALLASGVAALKIEGRMKSPEYVALVTGVYRAAIDRAAADPDSFAVTPGEWATLEEAFSRGFTEGSLTGRRGEDRMSWRRPNNRGVPIGRLSAVSEQVATVALDRALDADDVIEVWTARGRFAQKAGPMTAEGRQTMHAPAGSRVRVALQEAARAGDRVFRVVNASLLEAARRTYASVDGKVPLALRVRLAVGEPLELTASAGGVSASVAGPVVEEARTKRVTAEEVMEHVGRLGGTPYFADGWEIDLDPAAGIGFSSLHALRRDALAALDVERLAPWSSRRAAHPAVPALRGARRTHGAPELVAAVSTLEAAAACLDAGADLVLFAVGAASPARALPTGIEPLLPRVAHDGEIGSLLAWADAAPASVAGNLGLLRDLAKRGASVEADWGLNAVNRWSVEGLAEAGAKMVWASPELSGKQLADLATEAVVPVGALVYGRVEMMVAEHCVIGAGRDCDLACTTCARRRTRWTLRDAKGYEFPVTTDETGRTRIYNSVTLDLSRSISELLAAPLSALRLELQQASDAEAAEATRRWRAVLDASIAGAPAPSEPLVQPATSGHFYRGLR
jgi:U32 family peptidase